MGKNKNKNKNTNTSNQVCIMMKLLEDKRITPKDIQLYSLVTNDFPNAKIHDPISILDSKMDALNSYNSYVKNTLERPELTEDQIKKCLSNSYVRYYTHMLGLK